MKKTLIISTIVTIGIVGMIGYSYLFPKTPDWVTATVETGNVRETVAVSGFVEAKNKAELTFPGNGIVTAVLVSEGDTVKAGDILATLGSSELVADRAAAASSLRRAEATYSAITNGPRSETVAVADKAVANAKSALARVNKDENQKVTNAKAALLSAGLQAVAIDTDERSIPPLVSGTYSCETEGAYTISVYSSAAKSGYSYNYDGLESGNGTVTFDQPAPLGNCGLYLIFTAGELYSQSDWKIEVPNLRSNNYITLNNTLNLVQSQAESAINSATNALALAEKENALTTAPARSEEIEEARATVSENQARLEAIDARLRDRSIIAPFDGIITDTNITVGETSPNTPVITILASDNFTVTARIPEIDITKLSLGQKVEAVFDAKADEIIYGTVSYLSPIATEINGVAYFETTITLDQTPTWLRAGLNADVDIIIKEVSDVLRLPKRFVVDTATGPAVLIPNGSETIQKNITVDFTGNDGFIATTNLAKGDIVVAP